MKKVVLGKTGIEVSYLGLGTSAAYDGVVCPAKLRVEDYPPLLCHAYEQGVTYWDTSLTYGTHRALKETLKYVPRKNVVICSKTLAAGVRAAKSDVETALREIGTDYIDIFMLHCVKNKFEFSYRAGALEALCALKEKGYIRAVGLASHGLGALEACRASDKIEVVMGRINYSGHLMDSRQDDLKSILSGMTLVKKCAQKLIPGNVFKKMASSVQKPASPEERQTAVKIFQEIHAQGKGIIGMKVFGEGHLSDDVPRAVEYVRSLEFITSIVAGCCSIEELDRVIRVLETKR